MKQKKITLKITPQTPVRTTQGDRIFFKIPRHKLRATGLRRLERIERYNQYKLDVSALAKAQKFTFPSIGASVKFFIPVPKSWSKTKKREMHLQWHMVRKDLDNLMKALLDSLMKQDSHIAHFEAAKYWVNSDQGYIEITQTFKDVRIE